MLRAITVVVGWTAVLSNSIYGLFAPRFLGFGQPQLSATYSAAAGLMIGAQLGFPSVVARVGAHRACSLGLLAAGAGIAAGRAWRPPAQGTAPHPPAPASAEALSSPHKERSPLETNRHRRASAAACAAAAQPLVHGQPRRRRHRRHRDGHARGAPRAPQTRGRNLALLTSTRAAARVASPLVSSKLFELSCRGSVAPGALPFVAAAACATLVAPLPLLLLGAERREEPP